MFKSSLYFSVIAIQVEVAAIEIAMTRIQNLHQRPAQNIQLELAQVATHEQVRPKVSWHPQSNLILVLYYYFVLMAA